MKTVVLFFEKGAPTRKVWYLPARPRPQPRQDQPAQRRRPCRVRRVAEDASPTRPKSWTVDAKSIDTATFDLSVKNPNGGEAMVHRSPEEIMDEIAALDAESAAVLERIRGLL